MIPATRTPEVDDTRCPICGREFTLEPSVPPGDAPCPNCGCLVWFEIENAKPIVPRQSISNKRLQINAIVCEIAALSSSELGLHDFYERFLARTVQALAAVGGAVWLIENPRPWPLRWLRSRQLQLAHNINGCEPFGFEVDDRSNENECDG